MTEILMNVLEETAEVVVLVMLMMSLIEVFNVTTSGRLFNGLRNSGKLQILLAGALGSIPGCVGGFATVSLYSHRMMSFGALLTMLIASAGDEAFMMIALFPGKAVAIFASLLVLGVAAGLIADWISGGKSRIGNDVRPDDEFEIHACDSHRPYDPQSSVDDGLIGTANGKEIHNHRHNFQGIRHFLKEHIWKHVIIKHLPSIFLWTFSVLLVIGLISAKVDIKQWSNENAALMILIAALVGLIPQSGPHLIFITMFAEGAVGLPVLMANAVVQDGHASLALLAESKKSFVFTKLIKLALGLIVGYSLHFLI